MIKIENDGKGKCQSFEGHHSVDDMDSMGHYHLSLSGYGADEKECKRNLINQVDKMISKLKELKSELDKEL